MVRLKGWTVRYSRTLLHCFNSKMVRLKDYNIILLQFVRLLFQFQNGTIKSLFGSSSHLIQHAFQFQNGTIKSASPILIRYSNKAFQFQNGTIKRLLKMLKKPVKHLFQFQNGTIKRGTKSKVWRACKCFNSKMVRLKEPQRLHLYC